MLYNLAMLLPTAMCLFGSAWLICNRKSNTRSQNILTIGFLLSALFFLSTAHYILGMLDSETFMWWDIVDSFVTMAVVPTMYLYFRSMISDERFTWKEYIWFAPTLVVGGGTAIIYLLADKIEIDNYIESIFSNRSINGNHSSTIYELQQFIGVKIYNFAALLQVIGISTLAIWGLRKYHRRLHEFYSNADDKSIDTDTKILYWFLLTIPLSLALTVPDFEFWENSPILSSLLFAAWAVVYFAMFYYGCQKRHTVEDFVQDLQQADFDEDQAMDEECEGLIDAHREVSVRQLSPELQQRLTMLLEELINQQKVYLKSDLRLDEVARLMSTNRVYVSKVIKEQFRSSFSDYINGKRIDFSIELMREKPSLTQGKIAEMSGFINAQSYSRTFKKIIGSPPKEWLLRNADRV